MIGNILLTTALISAVFTIIMYYLTYKGYENTLGLARIGYHATAVMVIAAAVILLHAILTHQYQYKYVFDYSGSGLPTGLLISTFYAGQEGSFMLWTLWSVIIGLILLDYTAKRGDLEPRVMMVFTLAIAALLIMVSPLLKSPFHYIWSQTDFLDIKYLNPSYLTLPSLQNYLFSDPNSNRHFFQISKDSYAALLSSGITINDFIIQGKGLNPLLQNFWMQIHPPMLFIGFSMSAVPFSFALAALMKNDYKEWVKQSLPWVLAGSMVLGLAIMLGGYWAYGVLGWGGYWGWDPVENSSLVPWLVSVASIHTMLVQKKAQDSNGGSRFVKTNLILSIMIFVLVLYSTFLTRSGILGDASVHSFVDPGMTVYLFLILLLAFFAILGFGFIIYRWKYLTEHFSYEENILSRELALFTGSVALIASAIIILVGTSSPIFGQTVQLSFYSDLNLPLAIIIAIINGLSLLLKWKTTDGKDLLNKSKFSLASAFVLTILIIVFGGVHELMMILLTFSSAFALFVNLEIIVKVFKGRKNHLGAYVAHTGLALFLLGVIATAGYSKEQQVELVKGQKTKALGYELTFNGYKPIENGTKYAFDIEVSKGNSSKIVSPVMYISDFNNSLMREPDILEGLAKDFYVEPLSYSDGSENSSSNGKKITLKKGESYNYSEMVLTFQSFKLPKDAMAAMASGSKFTITAEINVKDNDKEFLLEPGIEMENGQRKSVPAMSKEINLRIELTNINANSGQAELVISKLDGDNNQPASPKEVLTINASIKPFISLVWAGVLIMAFGFIVSASRRAKESTL
ncbi:cytochrome c-type biogenesis CcmF C-terminal domain-containing protein [Melioribacteraceae bacterium 4301-Me]|uniref:cytochrome c-type biogenesis CcmF C-terminal domain-containing protein n=1 Tax=Pyranulibacter aquaticus TaxID=3163344 RepID=UPI00359AA30B